MRANLQITNKKSYVYCRLPEKQFQMLDEGSEIPLGDLHLPQDLRQLHWEKKAQLWAKAVIAATNVDSQTYTNQKAARGAALHTGRRGEEAGLLEGSYQAWASNWVPKKCSSNFILMNYIQFLTILKSQNFFFSKYSIFYATRADLSINSYRCFEGRKEMSVMELHLPRNTSQVS